MLVQEKIVIDEYPCLAQYASRRTTRVIAPEEAHALYEHNRKHLKECSLTSIEQALIDRLMNRYGPF